MTATPPRALRQHSTVTHGTTLGSGSWFLDSIAQGGRKISAVDPAGRDRLTPGRPDRLAAGTVPGGRASEVEITLVQRPAAPTPAASATAPGGPETGTAGSTADSHAQGMAA